MVKVDPEESPVPEPYRSAHRGSSLHREKLESSRWVGCFYCLMIYAPKSVKKWIDGDQTALCPVCGIDSVIPLTAEQFDSDFLEVMNRHYFAFGTALKGTMVQ